jgi:thioredoxin-related protein
MLNDLKGGVARKYKLTTLPTIMILDSKGQELARKEGRVGEVEFMNFMEAQKNK